MRKAIQVLGLLAVLVLTQGAIAEEVVVPEIGPAFLPLEIEAPVAACCNPSPYGTCYVNCGGELGWDFIQFESTYDGCCNSGPHQCPGGSWAPGSFWNTYGPGGQPELCMS